MGEGEYLEEQCQRAKAGMRLALHDLKRDAVESADPRRWARAHPLATVTAAAVAGFAASGVIVRESSPTDARHKPTNPVVQRPGRIARLFGAGMRIYSLAQPFIKAAIIARMSQNQHAD